MALKILTAVVLIVAGIALMSSRHAGTPLTYQGLRTDVDNGGLVVVDDPNNLFTHKYNPQQPAFKCWQNCTLMQQPPNVMGY